MSTPTMLQLLAEQVIGLFPALSRIRVRPQTDGGALAVGSTSGKVEIAGGGRPASGAGHIAFRIVKDSLTGIVYVSESASAPYTWTPIAQIIGAPTDAIAGTAVHIAEGSQKVQIDA